MVKFNLNVKLLLVLSWLVVGAKTYFDLVCLHMDYREPQNLLGWFAHPDPLTLPFSCALVPTTLFTTKTLS